MTDNQPESATAESTLIKHYRTTEVLDECCSPNCAKQDVTDYYEPDTCEHGICVQCFESRKVLSKIPNNPKYSLEMCECCYPTMFEITWSRYTIQTPIPKVARLLTNAAREWDLHHEDVDGDFPTSQLTHIIDPASESELQTDPWRNIISLGQLTVNPGSLTKIINKSWIHLRSRHRIAGVIDTYVLRRLRKRPDTHRKREGKNELIRRAIRYDVEQYNVLISLVQHLMKDNQELQQKINHLTRCIETME
jgi:hypothetical protein